MPKEHSPGKPTTRRCSEQEKQAAVRVVRTLRAELDTNHGTIPRVARQLGYGTESVRLWVRQAGIGDGHAPEVSTGQAARVRELEQEIREPRRANEILERAASFFGAELDPGRPSVSRPDTECHHRFAPGSAST
jgi:transposase